MTTDEDELDFAAGDWLFAQSCDFVRGIVRPEDAPPADRPEIAFAGRSNVGKSSLVNALTGRKTLARVSNTPGRTQQLNFFALPSDRQGLLLVDLPGYGFAQAPKKDVARWTSLTKDYLQGRATLKRVFLLIDSRHGIKTTDKPFMAAFDKSAISYQIVLTKLDKLSAAEAAERQTETLAELRSHPAAHPRLIASSTVTGQGVSELRAEIAALIDLAPLGYKGRAN